MMNYFVLSCVNFGYLGIVWGFIYGEEDWGEDWLFFDMGWKVFR